MNDPYRIPGERIEVKEELEWQLVEPDDLEALKEEIKDLKSLTKIQVQESFRTKIILLVVVFGFIINQIISLLNK